MKNNNQTPAICIIADVIESRKNKKEKGLETVVQVLNEKYQKRCMTPFSIRMGDEIFGVLTHFTDAYDALKDLFQLSQQERIPFYTGIGIGHVFVNGISDQHQINGTAIWNAADAIDYLKNDHSMVKHFKNKQETFKYF